MSKQKGLMEGKVALVTGSGGGVGRAYALALAAEGAKVVINDLGTSVIGDGSSNTPAEETLKLIQKQGGEGVINTDSVSTWDGARRIVECAMDSFGQLDAVINNAGILRDAIFHKMSEEEWLSVINVHLNGSFFVSRAAAEQFRKQESGAFVHTTSTSGIIGNVGQANYAAAKLGIVGLSKSIALDMQRYNVTSNSIAPFAWSRMTDTIPAKTPDMEERIKKLQEMTPDKNAPLVVFLSSDAAKDVTGQIFCVRNNEIFLTSHNRPIRSVQRDDGWTPSQVFEHAYPAFKPSFTPLDVSSDIFAWDPV